jgi:hypothetical protein
MAKKKVQDPDERILRTGVPPAVLKLWLRAQRIEFRSISIRNFLVGNYSY